MPYERWCSSPTSCGSRHGVLGSRARALDVHETAPRRAGIGGGASRSISASATSEISCSRPTRPNCRRSRISIAAELNANADAAQPGLEDAVARALFDGERASLKALADREALAESTLGARAGASGVSWGRHGRARRQAPERNRGGRCGDGNGACGPSAKPPKGPSWRRTAPL